MVGVLIDEVVDAGIGILTVHAFEVCALNPVPEMADDGIDEKHFAVLVPIRAPGIRGAMAVGLVDFAHGMVAPDAAGGGLTFLARRAGNVRPTRAGDADATVEPAIGAPLQAVGECVAAPRRGAETVEEDLRRAAGFVAVSGNPEQIRRTQGVDATEAALDAGEHLEIVGEDRALVEVAVVVGVFEDQDAIAKLEVEALLVVGVGIVLRNP